MVTNIVACSIAVDVAKQDLSNLPCLPVRVKTVRHKVRWDLCFSWDFTQPIMIVSYRVSGQFNSPFSRVKKSKESSSCTAWPWKVGQIRCHKTLSRNYHSISRISTESRSHLYCGGSVITRTVRGIFLCTANWDLACGGRRIWHSEIWVNVLILVNNQLEQQFFFRIYLFQFSTSFEHPRAHHQENQFY
jgi:hypothetical protein